ncbi:MAG: 50S ribosomal protein L23 [Nitrospirae bacterium CG18_big_fil_WC_8_21_14_2_50_70_55]|nr:50S ribosomal protein L23 [Deltaproteobacteria bacterium]OIP67001.1 MAG: 50S ribosomal protein L23 [Nitrospirae bacterium CG2_30_70_394]PIQ07264.1 MAG: 50S ribosomal protein L23 [Nitrospirae bacterium CG18_big_fil_WC_8_21_14_2_50_70_55]PIU80129.1 MAG: 50S ribosomal protein L23 [Nitrospirae bacterium CG06_land_8_20_14_3_00_70_43]PIW82696.1 MAG: 50S ribosomal protein L23 [Nitrospirae bacterium CG_4_8_14_3_um_filter_70_85]PIX84025.1 MAG: 50S ribosomal protein L23 [Nitrospirae bacterium CG_4_10
MNMNLADILLRPLVTEKTMGLRETHNQVAFEVHPSANKIQVRRAVESLFEVKVTGVRMLNVEGKQKRFGARLGRRKDWKKAIVHLAEGQSLDLFEGMAEEGGE